MRSFARWLKARENFSKMHRQVINDGKVKKEHERERNKYDIKEEKYKRDERQRDIKLTDALLVKWMNATATPSEEHR